MRVLIRNDKGGVKLGISLFVLAVIIVGAGYLYLIKPKPAEAPKESNLTSENESIQINRSGKLRKFSGPQFVDLYYRTSHPNTQKINEAAIVTGKQKVDEHIKRLARKRGYRIQSAPIADVLVKVSEDITLQPKAAAAWKKLKSSAKKDGFTMGLTAGFRSAEEQKEIFLNRLGLSQSQMEQIPDGAYDPRIDRVLATTSLPGYSKHHSGYTVDISCKSDPNVIFEKSECFKWLKNNNYKNAKNYGWIPSYPEGAKKQGPQPEAWEYVWVGKISLLE